jgi:DHA2 family multidrug resistance protein-like MFS transporter
MSTAPHRTLAGRREWLGLGVLSLACLLATMDLTILWLALPAIASDLGASRTEQLWITDVYGFLIAGSLITMGTLGDRVGRRRVLLWGAAAFGALSVLAAASTTPGMLIAARGLLGVAGAALAPTTLSLLTAMFTDPRQRTMAMGVWGSSFAVGAALGPIAGGAILEVASWHAALLAPVPVMVLILIAGPRLLDEVRDPAAGRLDLVSAALSVCAVLAVVFALKEAARDGLSAAAGAVFVLGIALGIVFARRQRRLTDPLIDLTLLRSRAFSTALGTNASAALVGFGLQFLVVGQLQGPLGFSPLEAGLWMLPGSIAVIAGGMGIAPRLVGRLTPAQTLGGALAISAAGALLFAQGSIEAIVAGGVLLNGAFGVLFSVTMVVVVSTAPPAQAGAASGMAETGTELCGALGIALLGTLATVADGIEAPAVTGAVLLLALAGLSLAVLRSLPRAAVPA